MKAQRSRHPMGGLRAPQGGVKVRAPADPVGQVRQRLIDALIGQYDAALTAGDDDLVRRTEVALREVGVSV